MNIDTYITERVDGQIKYFDSKAIWNQKVYKWLKWAAIISNVATTLTIALALTFIVGPYLKVLGVAALVFSTLVLATYQIEEVGNFGARWEKFRLVAEQLKSEKYLFLTSTGTYSCDDTDHKERLFIEKIEGLLSVTDLSHFLLMIEPSRRIERRLQ